MDRKSLELKADVNDKGEFVGIASYYDYKDFADDIVVKGAFAKTIAENKGEVVMLWQHDTKQPIGKMLLTDNEKGLEVAGFINLEVEKGKEAFALLKQGAIKGLSIGYFTREWDYDTERKAKLLKDIDLKEVSLVTFPCNDRSNVELATVKNEELNKAYEKFEGLKSEVSRFFNSYIRANKLKEIRKSIKQY